MTQIEPLSAINKVKFALTREPIEGRLLSELVGLSIEDTYGALVFLHERDMALISRMAKTGAINGWIAP